MPVVLWQSVMKTSKSSRKKLPDKGSRDSDGPRWTLALGKNDSILEGDVPQERINLTGCLELMTLEFCRLCNL